MLRVLHFSDVHVDMSLSSLPWTTWLGKRAIGGLNHALRRRRHFVHAVDKLGALARFAEEQRVDLALCTGDYTILGTEPELALAARAVAPLTTRPLGFATVPGNHDLYLDDSVREGRFEKYFAKWMTSDRPDLATNGAFPFVRLFGEELAVVGVSSARPNPEPWRSSGRVPEAQLEGLRRVLGLPEVRGRFVIVMTHYAPRLWNGRPDSITHGLDNADALLAVIAELPRGCLLHGHVHRRYAVRAEGVRPWLLGAGSTTQEGREGLWLIEIDRGSARALPGTFSEGSYRLDPEHLLSLT
ncbi:MAG: metallophosphoesterase family protein [Deltaproteobacteria bacterium]|jgi:3',5'-cyclic AMP phosphodiesterase CpdA